MNATIDSRALQLELLTVLNAKQWGLQVDVCADALVAVLAVLLSTDVQLDRTRLPGALRTIDDLRARILALAMPVEGVQ